MLFNKELQGLEAGIPVVKHMLTMQNALGLDLITSHPRQRKREGGEEI
jgi:hypothetical protein